MKNLLLVFAMVFCISSSAQITNPAPYCAPFTSSSYSWHKGAITNVSLGTLNNSTGLSVTTNQYTYYNTLAAPVLYRGNSYTLSVTFDSVVVCTVPSGCDNSCYGAWIDFDNNNSFTNSSNEHILIDTGDCMPGGCGSTTIDCSHVRITKTSTFTIPLSAHIGTARMRVLRKDMNCANGAGGAHYTVDPCVCYSGTSSFSTIGETEDYNVSIQDVPATTLVADAQAPKIFIYPNPTTGIVHLPPASSPVRIVNTVGQVIYSGNDPEADLSKYPSGLYYIRADSDVAVLQKL
jgi:hypothetical protein